MGSSETSSSSADTTPRVLLIGMMGAGKSTVGHELEALTGWPYLDNDELVLRATGRPTPEVLATADEPTLRRVEAAALDEALAAGPPLIAGVAARVINDPEARRKMRSVAFVVYLRAPIALLVERVGAGPGRPWLDDEPAGALEHLYEGREPLYQETADLILDVDGVSPADLAARIVEALRVAPVGDVGVGTCSADRPLTATTTDHSFVMSVTPYFSLRTRRSFQITGSTKATGPL